MNAVTLLSHLQSGGVLRSRWSGFSSFGGRKAKLLHTLTMPDGTKHIVQRSAVYALVKHKRLRVFQWGVNDGCDFYLTEGEEMSKTKSAVVTVPPSPTAESLLRELFQQMTGKTFIQSDEASIRFMMKHLQNPPLTMHSRIAMRLTQNEYNNLYATLEKIGEYLYPPQDEP